MTETGRVPYLSMIYAGQSVPSASYDPLCHSLRFNHQRLTAAGIRYDLTFVEWRPRNDGPPLSERLRTRVPDIDDVLKTVVVDLRYHEEFRQDPHLEFHESLARNVAIRRAAGSFILSMHANIYLGREIVAFIAQRCLRPMVLYRMTSVDLKLNLDYSAIDEAVLRDSRNYERRFTTDKDPSGGECLLLDRFSWHAIRGFNEIRGAHLDAEASFVRRARASGILISDRTANVYRLGREGGVRPAPASTRERSKDASPAERRAALYQNPAAWGLGPAPTRSRSANDVRIDFDAGAVPPLVSLRGITTESR